MYEYFDYEDWENKPYSELLIYLYNKFSNKDSEEILKKEISQSQLLTIGEINKIIIFFNDRTFNKSKIPARIMYNKFFCEILTLGDLRSSIKDYYLKLFEEDLDSITQDEILKFLIIDQLCKCYTKEEFKEINKLNIN